MPWPSNLIEKELVQSTKYKGLPKMSRQDYLAGLTRSVDRLSEEAFNNLTDEAADWVADAVRALNSKKPIPDFENPDEEEPENEDEDGDEELLEEAEEQPAGGTSTEDVPGSDFETEAKAEDLNEAEEASEETAPKIKKKAGRPRGKKPLSEHKVSIPPIRRKATPTRYDNMTGERNKYGIVAGTKADEVTAMFEKGATMAEVREKMGENYYNLLTRLAEKGHVIKKEGVRIFLSLKEKK